MSSLFALLSFLPAASAANPQTYFLDSSTSLGCGYDNMDYQTVPTPSSVTANSAVHSEAAVVFCNPSSPGITTNQVTAVLYLASSSTSAGWEAIFNDLTNGVGNAPSASGTFSISSSSCSSPTEVTVNLVASPGTYTVAAGHEIAIEIVALSNSFTICTGGSNASFITINPFQQVTTTVTAPPKTTTVTATQTTTVTSPTTVTSTATATVTQTQTSTTTLTSIITSISVTTITESGPTTILTNTETVTQTNTVTQTVTATSTQTSTATSITTTTSTAQPPSLTVESVDQNGQRISGYWTVLRDDSRTRVGIGYTPLTFTGLTAGATYTVELDSYASCTFDHWQDTGSGVDPRTFTATGAQTFVGVYDCASAAAAATASPAAGGWVLATPLMTLLMLVASSAMTVTAIYPLKKNV